MRWQTLSLLLLSVLPSQDMAAMLVNKGGVIPPVSRSPTHSEESSASNSEGWETSSSEGDILPSLHIVSAAPSPLSPAAQTADLDARWESPEWQEMMTQEHHGYVFDPFIEEMVWTEGIPTPEPGPDPKFIPAHFEETHVRPSTGEMFQGLHELLERYPHARWADPMDGDAPFQSSLERADTPRAGALKHFEQLVRESELSPEAEERAAPVDWLSKPPPMQLPKSFKRLSPVQAFFWGATVDAVKEDRTQASGKVDPLLFAVPERERREILALSRTGKTLTPWQQRRAAASLGERVHFANRTAFSGHTRDQLIEKARIIRELLKAARLEKGMIKSTTSDAPLERRNPSPALFADLALRRIQLHLDNGADCAETPAAHGCDDLLRDRIFAGLGGEW